MRRCWSLRGVADSWLADKGWLFGMALAAIVAAVIIGGIRAIARVAGVLVPFMAVLYALSAVLCHCP